MPLGGIQIMGGDHDCRAVGGEPIEELPECEPLRRVECRVGLIEQEAGRAAQEADREADALPPAAGETIQPLARAVAQLGELHGRLDGLLRGGAPAELQPSEEGKVLAHREALVERRALRHPAKRRRRGRHGARLGGLHAGQHLKEGGLARAVGAENRTRSPGATCRSMPSRMRRVPRVRTSPVAVSALPLGSGEARPGIAAILRAAAQTVAGSRCGEQPAADRQLRQDGAVASSPPSPTPADAPLVVLAIGDVVGAAGRKALARVLPQLRADHAADLVIVNGENASGGIGINARAVDELTRAGADVITLGNTPTASTMCMGSWMSGRPSCAPPTTWPRSPGTGAAWWRLAACGSGSSICKATSSWRRAGMRSARWNAVIAKLRKQVDHIVVDFHAEATSEKVAMAGTWMAA